jgi:hypothetical protein
LVIGFVSAPIFLILVVVAAVSDHNNGKIPAWVSWVTAIAFWGTVITFIIRAVLNKRRRNRTR